MRTRILLVRFTMLIAPVIAAIVMGGPATRAASAPIVIAQSDPAIACGSYTGKTSSVDVVDAINSAPSGTTIVVCPGNYLLGGMGAMVIDEKTLTIKRAVKGTTPMFTIDNGVNTGLAITESTVSIDGLVLNAANNSQTNYTGIAVTRSAVKLKGIGVIGPNQSGSSGMFISQVLAPKALAVSITDCYIAGFRNWGIYGDGYGKVTVSGCHIDGSDGGRVTGSPAGVLLVSLGTGGSMTGSVTGCIITNTSTGITLSNVSGASVSKNILDDFTTGIEVSVIASTPYNADNIKITGNTFLGIPASGSGVYVYSGVAGLPSIKKLSITGNTFVASPFGVASTNMAVNVRAEVPALATVTVTVSGNKFLGVWSTSQVVNYNGNATVTTKGSKSMP